MELRSRTDSLSSLQDKMQEYMDSGVCLGWLFNSQGQEVEIYRVGQSKEVRWPQAGRRPSLPTDLSGESVLPGFELTAVLFAEHL